MSASALSGDWRRSSPSEIAADREYVKRFGLHGFVQLAYSHVEAGEFSDNWHIEEICNHLEAVTAGLCKRLIINIPPGCMKSLLVSVFWPIWSWIARPELKWMFGSFDASLSRRDALRAKDLLDSEWFQERWGDKVGLLEAGRKAESATEYYTNKGGMRFSTSVAGKATGWHTHIQVCDDPIKPRDTKGGSEVTGVKLEEEKQWWSGTMASRQADPNFFCRVIVMQRLHEDDLTGVCSKDPSYVVLRLPMEFEADNRCVTPFGGDRRTKEGELLWPERFNAQAVADLKDPIKGLGPVDYAAQCQQRPMPKAGGVFRSEFFRKRFKAVPADAQWLQSWDMRFIESATRGDFVVGGVWAYCKAQFYLVKVYRGRWSFDETVSKMREAHAAWPLATLKLVEDKANGPAVCNTLKDEIPGIVLVSPEGGKIARANAVSPLFEAGNVWLPDESLGEAWVDDYEAEMCAFPRGRFDDQVDMTSQALLRLKASLLMLFLQAMDEVKGNG